MFTVHKILDNSSYKMGWREATMDFTVGRGILAGLDNTQNKSVHKLKKTFLENFLVHLSILI